MTNKELYDNLNTFLDLVPPIELNKVLNSLSSLISIDRNIFIRIIDLTVNVLAKPASSETQAIAVSRGVSFLLSLSNFINNSMEDIIALENTNVSNLKNRSYNSVLLSKVQDKIIEYFIEYYDDQYSTSDIPIPGFDLTELETLEVPTQSGNTQYFPEFIQAQDIEVSEMDSFYLHNMEISKYEVKRNKALGAWLRKYGN